MFFFDTGFKCPDYVCLWRHVVGGLQDSLHLVNKSFGFYINSSMPHACDDYPRVCDRGSWNMMGDTNYPDMFMDGVG